MVWSLLSKGNVIIISSNNLYKLIDTSLDLKIYLLSSNKETIRKYTNININRYDAYRIANDETNKNKIYHNSLELQYLINQFIQLKSLLRFRS